MPHRIAQALVLVAALLSRSAPTVPAMHRISTVRELEAASDVIVRAKAGAPFWKALRKNPKEFFWKSERSRFTLLAVVKDEKKLFEKIKPGAGLDVHLLPSRARVTPEMRKGGFYVYAPATEPGHFDGVAVDGEVLLYLSPRDEEWELSAFAGIAVP